MRARAMALECVHLQQDSSHHMSHKSNRELVAESEHGPDLCKVETGPNRVKPYPVRGNVHAQLVVTLGKVFFSFQVE